MSNANDPLTLGFSSLYCISTTSGPGDDEPYCVFLAADTSAALPAVIASRTSVFDGDQSVSDGDVRQEWVPLWGLNKDAAPIAQPTSILVLAALMENDSSDPDAVVSAVQVAGVAGMAASVAAHFNRSQTVSKLIGDMFGALGLGASGGGAGLLSGGADERIGVPQEVALAANDLLQARWGRDVAKMLTFKDEGTANYEIMFNLRPVLGWIGWEDLGGPFETGAGVAAWDATRLDVFAMASGSGNIAHLGGSMYDWSAWEAGLGNHLNAQFKDAPSAVSSRPNRIDVCVRGMDDRLGHAWWDGANWAGWAGLGQPPNVPVASAPALVARNSKELAVYVRGADNALWVKFQWPNGYWSSWESLGGSFKDAPAAVARGEDAPKNEGGAWHRTDIFVRGMDDQIGHLWLDTRHSESYQGWQSLGHPPSGPVTSGPAVASWADGRLDVFVRGAEHALWHIASTDAGSTWSAWSNLGGHLLDAPAAVSAGPNRIEIVARGNTQHLGRLRWLGAYS